MDGPPRHGDGPDGQKRKRKPRKKAAGNGTGTSSGGGGEGGSSDVVAKKQAPTRAASAQGDPEMCVVCTEDVKYAATFQCNHYTCHMCALRLRALLKQDRCPSCRTQSPFVAISGDVDRPYAPFEVRDDGLGLMFESDIIKEDVLYLLKFNCPVVGCTDKISSWKELKAHVPATHHGRVLCDICIAHKSTFSIELDVYNPRGLLIHQRDGDPAKGFTGHPACKFCNKRFYSGDELYAHGREKHEQCFICDRQNREAGGPVKEPVLYRDYPALESHFRAAHFACMMPVCLAEKFVVFGTNVELLDHMLSRHPEVVGKSKAARRIEPTYVSSAPSARGGGGGGFGGNLSTIDTATINTMATNANTSSRPGSGGRGRVNDRTDSQADSRPEARAAGALASAEAFPALGASRARAPQTPVQPATVTTFHSKVHAADMSFETLQRRLDERAKIYLSYDSGRLSKFEEINNRYKASSVNASALMFEYTRLFENQSPEEIGLIVDGHAKLLQRKNAVKAKDLLKAYNDWKPKTTKGLTSASSSSSSIAGSAAAASSGTIKNVSSIWSNRQTAGNLSGTASFPELPKKATSQPKSTPSPTPKPYGPGMNDVTRGVNGLAVSKKSLSRAEFPALPPSSKKIPPPVSQPVPKAAWGQPDPEPEPEIQYKGKKGKKKQVLMRIGI